jgi:UDP-N-acetylmuramoyl-tripeptide--D-alanyl-D-alanine ligase
VRGPRLDGHDYVAAALGAGAASAVVASERQSDFPEALQSKLLSVPDPLAALQTLAAGVRRKWGGPVVAITGSAGKTTTKQMIAALLGTKFRVLENIGNLNNQFGLPLSLLRLEPETEIGVFEMGMSGPGEIRLLAGLADPDVGVVTNVSAAHLEFFPNVEAIARAKFELVESLGADDWAVLNADDPRVATFGLRLHCHLLHYGLARSADLRADDLHVGSEGGYTFRLPPPLHRGITPGAAWKGRRAVERLTKSPSKVRFHLPLLGRHNVSNVLAAMGVAYLFGIRPPALADAVSNLSPAPHRGEMARLESGALVVNDCYNSNPDALEAMLRAVAEIPAQRRFAVLGGMMELGASSEQLHRDCGRRLAELQYTGLITVGDVARPLAEGARAAGLPASATTECATPEEAGERLRGWLQKGDIVLLKGSRAVHLETIWDRLGPLAAPSTGEEVTAGSARRGEGT